MRKRILLSLLIRVFFLLWSHAHARFVVEKNSLKITSPPSLKGTYQCALANFGIPLYGGTMVGMLSLPSSNPKACKDFTDFGLTFKPKPGMLPSFALVDRGDCYFTTKAWNAQKAGAAAIIVVNDTPGPLITMNAPEEESPSSTHLRNITVPAVLVAKALGESLKRALSEGKMVALTLDWRETVPHPDDRVEYEFWINSNDETQIEFVKGFRGVAQIMEKKGYTQFTPRYLTWYCPDSYGLSKQCKSQCINKGRYCAPDPDPISDGYDGRDVVVQNLRQICVFRVANESRKPWVWWDYVADFSVRCGEKERKYVGDCANEIIGSLGLDRKKVDACVGDLDADRENPVLRDEQEAQVGKDLRGDVTILPTLVINNRQYRGKLDKGAVLKAICSGFQETTEPAICLTEDIQTNECLENNGGCWEDKLANVTACRDTFRGRVCQCPVDQEIKYVGDGYKHCEAKKSTGGFSWTLLWALIVGLFSTGAAGYALYKYRIRSYMDSEIRAIMAQYMPLDNQAEIMGRPIQIQK